MSECHQRITEKVQAPQRLALIDDDPLVHATWSMVAKSRGDVLQTFLSYEQFEKAQIASETPIYVDYHLGSSRGTEIAKRLHRGGYRNLYITTGRNSSELPPSPEIKGIKGKQYPFDDQ